jgi:ferric-dicitrate binding protein FerR (iron transport regulator)
LEKYTDSNERIFYIAGLLHRVRGKETLSSEEQQTLQAWREASAGNEALFHRLQDPVYLEMEVKALLDMDYQDSVAELFDKLGIEEAGRVAAMSRIRRMGQSRRWVAAALILLCIGAYLWLRKAPIRTGSVPAGEIAKADVAPGGQGAILTLADGSTVVLDSLGNGPVATQGGSKVLLQNGQLAYKKNNTGGELIYNKMTTPKGRQFQLLLPDGTRVWLNAASSIHYPVTFAANTRTVDITGEAYFEVAKDNARPFHVQFATPSGEGGEVEVLGTDFNINAYSDEASANTTLLEGSVRIIHGAANTMLRPGEQAQVSAEKAIHIVSDANIEKVMAWKNGVFDFQDATLEEVMRQLQRWYDIEVVYEKDVPKLEFIGRMGRDLSLSKVLSGLEVSKVHFRLEGRRLVVLP